MPFTPFHFGHILPIVFGDLKHKRIDVISSIVGGVIIDIEPIIILLFGLNIPLHGILHTFNLALILGIVVGITVHLTTGYLRRILRFFRWQQATSLKNKMFWASFMAVFHVFLDSTMYIEMNPFLFVSGNLFYGLMDPLVVYINCSIGLIIGLILYGTNIVVFRNMKDVDSP